MEPLKPDVKKSVLENSPQAGAADLEEYERLLSLRFTVNPEAQGAPEARERRASIEKRIRELHQKLFPKSSRPPTQSG
jgi:hypothetical protein